MASLRRIASLDSEPRASSNPGTCLTRHSSLPNLFLGQPELSMKALRKPTTSRPRKTTCQSFPPGIDSPSLHTHSPSSKLPLCRALSSTHSFDELPLFDNLPNGDVRSRFTRPTDAFGARRPSHGFQRKEVFVVAGKQSLDLEKSIVYTELKETMWKFEAPPSLLKPSHIEGSPCAGISTHIHEAPKPMKNPDLCMDSKVKGRPLSLQMLKRKLSQVSPQAACNSKSSWPGYRRQFNEKYSSQPAPYPGSTPKVFTDAGDSVSSAFASLFLMMKMLQQYAHSLRMRSPPSIFGPDPSSHENLVGRACVEMLDSFLWLFQQVFSCTPRLMLLTMVLLADFTLHSMSMHVAFPVMPLGEPPTPTILPLHFKQSAVAEAAVFDAHKIYHPGSEEKLKVPIVPSKIGGEFLLGARTGGSGNGGHAITRYRDFDHGEDPRLPQTETIPENRATVNGDDTNGGVTLSSSLLHHVQAKPSEYLSGREGIELDVPTKRMLVAPVRAPTLEADDYSCYDRTDLAYQREISEDPTNPLLLANYAQFLHVVRHDHGRAEVLYKKAVSAEVEVDGEVMGRYASFLWVAKGDVTEADRAYKAAAMADPTNAFHAGNYAHFLWNLSASQGEEMPSCINNNMNATSQQMSSS